MTPVRSACTSFRFSTNGLPEMDRGKAVREICERTGLPGGIEPLEPLPHRPVRADITKWALPGLGVMCGTLSGLRQIARPEAAVSSAEDDLLLAVNLSGDCGAEQCGQELRLRGGDAVLATRGLTGFTIIRPTAVRVMGFRVPRGAIAPLVGRLDEAPIRLVPHGTNVLDLLVAYAGAIVGGISAASPVLQRLYVTHTHDLIAAIVSVTRDGRRIVEDRGLRAARLQAIMADIAANLTAPDLTAGAVATRQRMTARYVHKLFEGEGITFSAFVLGRRLACAHRMLTDPRFGDRSISSIAFDVGFGDLSYFNRSFRRCYDATPSEIRRSANETG